MDSHLNRNLPPIHTHTRARAHTHGGIPEWRTRDRMEGRSSGRSVFASRVMATEGPPRHGPPRTGSPKDGCLENGRANKPSVRVISLP
jgi:hypothetical protein